MNWQSARLGDITTVLSGTTPESMNTSFWGGSHVWVTPTDLGKLSSTYITDSGRKISDAGVASCNLPPIPKGAVIMSSRAPIGHLAIAGCNLYTNQGCKSFACSDLVDPEFLFFSLQHRMPAIQALGSGATFVEVSKSALKDFEISFPEIDNQRRIAARLKSQLAAVEEARSAAQARVRDAQRLIALLSEQVFDGEEAEKWKFMPLGEAGEIVSGITLGRKSNAKEFVEVPYLRVANLQDGRLDLADVKKIQATPAEISRWQLQRGDILLTEGGDPDKLGRGTFWSNEIPNCIHQNHIFRVRLTKAIFLPEFVSAQLGSSYGKRYFLANAKKTTGIASINQQVLRAFPLRVPPIQLQQSVMTALSERLKGAQEILASAISQLAEIEKLPYRLLAQAFAETGENP